MDAKYACKSGEHVVARRQFLGAMAAAGAALAWVAWEFLRRR